MSTTSTPAPRSPATSAACSASPLGRLSRPTATDPFTPFSERNVAYAPASAVATSGVRSLSVTPRMSYSRKMCRASPKDLPRLKRDISAHDRSATLRERNDSVREQSKNENDDYGSPHNCTRPAASTIRQCRGRRARLHEHHHHHIQIVPRAHHARDDEPHGQLRLWERRLERSLEHVPLGEEPDAA